MGNFGKLAAMAVAITLGLYGVITLKGVIGESELPSASMEGTESPRTTKHRVSHQPTILQARPAGGLQDQDSPYRGSTGDSHTVNRTVGEYPTGLRVPSYDTSDPRLMPVPISVESQQMDDSRLPQHAPHLEAAPSDADARAASREVPTWTTVENDSLWTICEARYGSGEYFRALYAANRNRIQRPDSIRAGIVLTTPNVNILRSRYPELCPPSPAISGSADRLIEPNSRVR